MNYIREFRRAEEAFHLENYDSCVRICGRLAECGLKDLYGRQRLWYSSKGKEFNLEERFRIEHKGFETFSVDRSGLSRLLQFYQISGMWDEVRLRVSSNLHFTQRIPWKDLRCVRNDATHNSKPIAREHAVEFLHHLKVFLYECELAEDPDQIKPDFIKNSSCGHCGSPLIASWNYCPHCGNQHKVNCKNCGAQLEPSWKICPHCNDQSGLDNLSAETERLFKAYCEAIWADHVVNADERDLLRRKRLELGITEDKAEEIEKTVINPSIVQFIGLIEAVLIDGIIDDNEREFLLNKAKSLKVSETIALRLMDNLKEENDKQLTTLL